MTRSLTFGKEDMFQRIDHLAQRHMHHGYLAQCGIAQPISRFHFDVGYEILTAANVDARDMEQVLTAVLLLEQGLSIHDGVDNADSLRQPLIVLAGDYDSSKYYYILARLNRSRLIYVLCEAVTVVNEAKMRIVTEPDLTAQQYLWLMQTVEGELLSALAAHYLGKNDVWHSNIESLVRAYVVQVELTVRKERSFITTGQASEWLKRSMTHVDSNASNASNASNEFVAPLYHFAVEYFQPLQRIVGDMRLAEGNH